LLANFCRKPFIYSPGTPLDSLPRVLPFNRLETSFWHFFAALPHSRGGQAFRELRDAFCQVTGCADVIFTPSCRSAIAQILTLLPHRDVLLPAYTCPVVKTAVELAGKRIVWVEIPKNSLNASPAHFAAKIRPGSVLIPTHVFGIPEEIETICALARHYDCVTIEDVAGGFGLRHNGHWLGSFGDFGVFSFERSKRLPAFRGGAILINNPDLIDSSRLASLRFIETRNAFPWRDFIFALAHKIAMHPWLYPKLVSARALRKAAKAHLVVQTKAPEAPLQTPFYTREFHAYQAALLLRMLPRMDRVRERISELVSVYRDTLQNSPLQIFLHDSEFDFGGMLRFPVAFPGKDRSQIMRMARERGIPVEVVWEEVLPEPGQRADFPNAIWATHNVVLLPLYTSLAVADARRIALQLIAIHRDAPSITAAPQAQPFLGSTQVSRSATLPA
jgi:dTDP-4-amino-4,6-dideoxygalactose transaminase